MLKTPKKAIIPEPRRLSPYLQRTPKTISTVKVFLMEYLAGAANVTHRVFL
jgi:hypothetical protein